MDLLAKKATQVPPYQLHRRSANVPGLQCSFNAIATHAIGTHLKRPVSSKESLLPPTGSTEEKSQPCGNKEDQLRRLIYSEYSRVDIWWHLELNRYLAGFYILLHLFERALLWFVLLQYNLAFTTHSLLFFILLPCCFHAFHNSLSFSCYWFQSWIWISWSAVVWD